MGFNRRDLENDDDDFNDFGDLGNDFGGDDDEFPFGDEDAGAADLGDNDRDFTFEEDMPVIEEEAEESQGPNRTFIIIAAALIGLFVLILVVVLIVVSRPSLPTDIDLTRTAIIQQNATVMAQSVATQTAAVEVAQLSTQTAEAEALALTQTAQVPPTATPTPTETPSPTLDPTQQAANDLMTQTAVAIAEVEAGLTLTAQYTPPTPEVMQPNDVALTATALAIILAPPTIDPNAPTQEGGIVPTAGVPVGVPTALPETGFFDDLATSGANMGALALMAFGLLAVIVISRRLRVVNTGK